MPLGDVHTFHNEFQRSCGVNLTHEFDPECCIYHRAPQQWYSTQTKKNHHSQIKLHTENSHQKKSTQVQAPQKKKKKPTQTQTLVTTETNKILPKM